MEEKRYYVEMDGRKLAESMAIDTALLLVDATIQKYHCDMSRGSLVSIGEMDRTVRTED